MLMASIFRWRPQFFVSVSSTEEDCLEERRCQECSGEAPAKATKKAVKKTAAKKSQNAVAKVPAQTVAAEAVTQ